jgi:GNAT superfamily N-acetyltransferase
MATIDYRPMDRDYILPVCPKVLERGPFDRGDPVGHSGFVSDCPTVTDGTLRTYVERYGTCGYLAWDKYAVVGAALFFPLNDLPQKVCKVYDVDEYPRRWFDALNKEKGTMVMGCVVVTPAYRDQGIGGKLVEASLGWMKRNRWLRAVKLGVPSEVYGYTMHFNLPFWLEHGFRVFRLIDRSETEPWASRERSRMLGLYESGHFNSQGVDFCAILHERGWQGILGVNDLEQRFA